MRVLKIYGFFIGLILLINVGSYLHKSGIIKITPKVISVEKWQDVLIGKWAFHIKEIHPMETVFFEGEAEYFADSTFRRSVTYKSFYNNYAYEPEDELSYNEYNTDLVMNGSVTGVWKIGNGQFWEETAKECNMAVDYCTSDCKEKYGLRFDQFLFLECMGFYPEARINYGTIESEYIRMEIQKFTQKEIIIKKTDFTDNSEAILTFKRLKS